MKKLKEWLKKLDNEILLYLLTFFIFLIPLYPKIPLMVVNYTYVAIRAEDFFIALLSAVFIIQLIRRRVTLPNKKFVILFGLFWVAVFTSYYLGYFVNKTIPIEFNKVAFYHSLRRVEYMILFFIAAGAVRSIRDFKILLYSLFFSLLLVDIYGLGQRFIDFPAIQTMNPEYAKGRILFLTPEARISSTFAGHYDLSAFIVFLMPLLWGVYVAGGSFLSKAHNFWLDPLFFIRKFFSWIARKIGKRQTQVAAFVEDFKLDFDSYLPIVTFGLISILLLALAVKTYESAVFVSLSLVLLAAIALFIYRMRPLALLIIFVISIFTLVLTSSRVSYIALIVTTPLFLWYIRRYFLAIVAFAVIFGMTFTNSALIERFAQTFQIKLFLVDTRTGETHVVQEIKSNKLPAGSQVLLKVDKKKTTSQEEALKKHLIAVAKLTPTPRPTRGPLFGLKITPIALADAAAFKQFFAWAPDISFSTRLQVEWPRAIGAFKYNPIFGTGPASITDATDNDYLRSLGEFGLLGTLLLGAILLYIARFLYTRSKQLPENLRPLTVAPIFSLLGLLINAGYIDVFEASKVAFVFWYTMGIYVGLLKSQTPKS